MAPVQGNAEPVHVAAGNLGQFIFVAPEHQAVVVFTAGIPGNAMHDLVTLFRERIVPAFRPST
jgi:hypothetical protein